MEEKNVAQKTDTSTEKDAAESQEEKLANLEKEVASIKGKIKECTQGMMEAQNTLAKVGELYFYVCVCVCGKNVF